MSELRLTEDILDRMVRAVERVQQRLHRTVSALEAAGIPYAVAGENAVAAWVATVEEGAVRNTRDVDIAIQRADLEAVQVALSNAGFVFRNVKGINIFLDGPVGKERDAVRILFAGERVQPDGVIPAPELSDSAMLGAFRVVALESLVKMNLTSFRDLDRMLLIDLIDVGLVDGSWPSRLPEELSIRLKELLDNPEG